MAWSVLNMANRFFDLAVTIEIIWINACGTKPKTMP